MSEVVISPFGKQTSDQIFDLILPIQQQEFGIAITRDKQPDLLEISNFYQKGLGNFWVAVVRDLVVGTIGLKDIGNQQVALRKMFVHADYRGRKNASVAAQLLETALAWAKSKYVTDIFLGTTAAFLAAHRFYEKHGFREIEKSALPPSFPVMSVDSKFYRYHLAGV